MGLTIYTTLRLDGAWSDAAVRAKVRAVRQAAAQLVEARGLKGIGTVVAAARMPMIARWLSLEIDEHTSTGIEIPPLVGWCFPVAVGQGCEPALFGLCRYPATVEDAQRGTLPTHLEKGWSFQSGCKTQYANIHGWEHFLKCHRAVIDLGQLWAAEGVTVEVIDEGDYWPHRDERALRNRLRTYDRIVAGFAGAMKDASADDDGSGVQAPIFEHPDFERLEAEGVAKHGAKLKAARAVVSKEVRDRRTGKG